MLTVEPQRVRWPARLLALIGLFAVSQRLYAWPLPYAWHLGVGAAEWGHWMALAALILGVVFRDVPTRVLCLLTVAIGLAPSLQAQWYHSGFRWRDLATGLVRVRPADREIEIPGGQKADLYIPKQTPAPGVLVVHGGSWARGNRKEFAALNSYLRERGYFVASLDYRLAPAHPYPAAPQDLDAAYDYLTAHGTELGLDRTRMCWLGRSAGGHLALLQAYTRRPTQAVVAYYAPTDMLWSYEHPSNPRILDSCRALSDFLGGTPDQVRHTYEAASPLQQVRAGAPPTLLISGAHDDLVYVEQSHRMARRLAELGVPYTLETYGWANHGFDINLSGPGGQLATRAVESFLATHLRAR